MRYKTFRTLMIVGGVAVAGALGYCGMRRCSRGSGDSSTASSTETPAAKPTGTPSPGTQPAENEPAPAGDGIALRPFDNEVVALGERTLSGDKLKDALPGRPFKVNLYQDSGKKKVNRLKLDLDRDDKWDEKWTFEEEGGRPEVKRQVAPDDDEQYGEEYRLRAGRWVKKK